jgi:hypothetical protein
MIRSVNFVACQQLGLRTHLGDVLSQQKNNSRRAGIFPESAFVYQPQNNTSVCPAGQLLKPRRLHPHRRTREYQAAQGICAQCPLRLQYTRSRTGRTLKRHEHQDLLDRARAQAHSAAARRDRHRRQVLIEGSFADAANHHGFKRSRWRRLWRQQIQDWMIAAIQNIRILMRRAVQKPKALAAAVIGAKIGVKRGQSHRTLPRCRWI